MRPILVDLLELCYVLLIMSLRFFILFFCILLNVFRWFVCGVCVCPSEIYDP